MINLINAGVGNLKAISNTLKSLEIPFTEVNENNQIINGKIILPGVGHFDYFMESLVQKNLKSQIIDLVINKNYPILGICVGMQALFDKSDEGKSKGFGFLKGQSKKFINFKNFKVPHMGWNNIKILKKNKIFENLSNDKFYFANSFFVDCDCKYIIAQTQHSNSFASVVNFNNIYGVQFHPEKSYDQGQLIIKNFCSL